MILRFPFAHIPSHFAEDGRRGHHINAVNLGEILTRHAKYFLPQLELRSIAFFRLS